MITLLYSDLLNIKQRLTFGTHPAAADLMISSTDNNWFKNTFSNGFIRFCSFNSSAILGFVRINSHFAFSDWVDSGANGKSGK